MPDSLQFVERDADAGWSVVVTRAGIAIGYIRKVPEAPWYRYDPAEPGMLDPILQDNDLEHLKTTIIRWYRAR